jgi:hypothetical protein
MLLRFLDASVCVLPQSSSDGNYDRTPPPLDKQGFVSQHPTRGFSMKRECANTHISRRIRDTGCYNGHLAGRALEVALTRMGGGGDSGGGDNPGGGCGTPVTGQDEKQKGGAREVLRRRASRDGGRKKWSAVVSTAF